MFFFFTFLVVILLHLSCFQLIFGRFGPIIIKCSYFQRLFQHNFDQSMYAIVFLFSSLFCRKTAKSLLQFFSFYDIFRLLRIITFLVVICAKIVEILLHFDCFQLIFGGFYLKVTECSYFQMLFQYPFDQSMYAMICYSFPFFFFILQKNCKIAFTIFPFL